MFVDFDFRGISMGRTPAASQLLQLTAGRMNFSNVSTQTTHKNSETNNYMTA
jgi:hypothetical protein